MDSFQRDRSSQEPQCWAPHISHKNSGGRKIEDKKSTAGRSNEDAKNRYLVTSMKPGGKRHKSEAHDTHATRKSIHPVHEVVQVRHPDQDQNCDGRRGPAQSPCTETGSAHGLDYQSGTDCYPGGGENVSKEAKGRCQSNHVVEERNTSDEKCHAHNPQINTSRHARWNRSEERRVGKECRSR